MNIDEYRAMKAQEATPPAAPPTVDSTLEQPPASVENTPPATPTPPETTPTQEAPITPVIPSEVPSKIMVDGEELTLEQIKELKQGNMRLRDYTKKTQEVASQRKEAEQALLLYNQLQQNPQILQSILQSEATPLDVKQTAQLATPEVERVQKLEQQLADMQLQREIEELSRKYDDFDVVKVLNAAAEKNLLNLEDAYKLTATPKVVEKVQEVDVEALKNQLRTDLLAEIERDKQATQSIITSNDAAPVLDKQEPVLTEDELRVATRMKLTPEEYLKWGRRK